MKYIILLLFLIAFNGCVKDKTDKDKTTQEQASTKPSGKDLVGYDWVYPDMNSPMAMIQAIMGHKSIDTTEQYAVIDLKKLRRHFPTLLPQYTDARIEDEKVSKTSKVDTNQVDTGSNYIALTNGKLMN